MASYQRLTAMGGSEAVQLAAEYLRERIPLEVVSQDRHAVTLTGGDGTVTSAAARLTDTPSALGVLPLGTMNLLARDIGVPLELDEAVRALAAGEIKAVDAAEVNGHVFLNHSVLGLYPRLVEEREHTRKAWHLHKWPAMAVAWAKVLRTKPMVDVDLLVGGESRRFRTPALAVANNAYADTGFLSRDRLDTADSI